MSRGKYSPNLPDRDDDGTVFVFNCYGQKPTPWYKALADAGAAYDEKTMFDNYDSEGFDRYGYSCFDRDGEYVGIGAGVDRNGYTESDYLTMDEDDFNWRFN